MKTLVKIFLVLSIVLGVSGIVLADYTFDGEFDPGVLPSWAVVMKVQTGPNEGMAGLKNPDQDAKINHVIVTMRGGYLITYEYMIDGKTYKYEYDFETEHFGLVK